MSKKIHLQVVERLLDTYPDMVITVRKCNDSGGKYFLVSKAALPTEECLLPAFSASILPRSSGEFGQFNGVMDIRRILWSCNVDISTRPLPLL